MTDEEFKKHDEEFEEKFDEEIAKKADVLAKVFNKAIVSTARGLAKNPEVIKYFKVKGIPGGSKLKMRIDYLSDELWTEIHEQMGEISYEL